MRILDGIAVLALGLTIGATIGPDAAVAQEQSRVDAKQDWSIFTAGDGDSKVCWIASKPTESGASRGGNAVEVRRGDIYLMVTNRPSDGTENEVSFVAGYPFKKGSTVEAKVGTDSFEMFTVEENAWLSSKEKDAQIVDAFRRGVTATVSGVSSRGTTTTDTFSLQGFTAALGEAKKRCQ